MQTPDPISGGVAAAAAAVDIYKLAKELGWIDRLKTMFRKKRRIVVLGSTGAGKTQFIRSLSKQIPDLILNTDRTKFNIAQTLDLANQLLLVIDDTPGQAGHNVERSKAVREAMLRGHGVINVVSYGYHEWDIAADQALTKADEPRQNFLQSQRQVEIDQLAEWNGLLSAGVENPWLITVATKADLWWEQRTPVREHYESGPYFAGLGPAQAMRPAVCLYSSIYHRFYGTAPVSGYFDDAERLHLRANFFRVLFEAVGKTI